MPERHCIYHGPYGKRLERLGIPLKIQQLADRKSAKGVTWSMDGPIRRLRQHGCIYPRGCLVILTAVHRFGADFLCALALGGMLSMKQMMSRPMTYGNRIIPARVILCFAPKLL